MKFFRSMNSFVLFLSFTFCSQVALAVLPANCPTMQKRNNGNGLWGDCAGQGVVPVAANVVGTSYANFFTNNNIVASTKTGDINFYWPGVTNITELYVITRVWVGTTILATKVGPPPVPTVRNGNTYATYCFYVVNLPNAGVLTLEFTNPQTGLPVRLCSYDLKTGATTNTSVSCAPTFNTQPSSKTVCGDTTSFRSSVSGASSYQWEYSSNGGSSWSNVTGGHFSGTTTATLSIISNATTYNGYKFRLVATGAGPCGSTTSDVVTLTAYPKPTAAFDAGAIVCGVGTYNLRINFTGTGPWSFTYTTNGGSAATVSNIAASAYYLAVSPLVTTTYAITALNDRYCANYSVSAPVTIVVQAKPTITLSASTIYACYSGSASTASLVYSGTANSPTQYSITAGSRAMPMFSAVSNAALGSSPITVNIPAGTAAGTYDFNLRVKVASPPPGCESDVVPFTVVVRPQPALAVTASPTSVCPGGTVNLLASPNLSGSGSYAWTSSPSGFTSSIYSPSATPSVATTYTVTYTETSSGCTNSGSVAITMKAVPTVTVNDPSICNGNRAVLTASGASTYSWTLSNGSSASATLSTTTGSSVLASPTSTTTYTVTGTNSVGCTGSDNATVTVTAAPTVSISSNRSVCEGSSITLTATSTSGSSLSWAPGNSISSTYTVTPTTNTIYSITATLNGCSATDTQLVIVKTSPVTSYSGPKQYYCSGDYSTGNAFSTISINTSSNSTFVWYRNSTAGPFAGTYTAGTNGNYQTTPTDTITSATTSSVDLKTPASNDQFYKVVVKNGGCRFVYYIDIINLTSTSISPSIITDQTYCGSTDPTTLLKLNGSAFGSGYTYQWTSNTTSSTSTYNNISGQTSSSYDPPTVFTTTWYKLNVVKTGNCAGTYTSNFVTITINTSITNNTITATNCGTGVPTITQSGTLSGGSGTYTYIWEQSTDGTTWTTIPDATSQTYTGTATLTQKTWFRRTVSSGGCTDISANLILTPAILGNEISNGYAVCLGSSATAFGPVSPTGGEGSGSYTYQWQESADGITYSNVATGGTSSSYTPLVNAAGTKYYTVIATSGACSTTSNASIVTVNALPTVTVSPSTATVCNGTTTTLTASGAATYVWTPSTGLDVTSGAVVKATPSSTTTYSVSGTDANSCVSSGTATITVNALPTAPTPAGTMTATACVPPTYDLTASFITSSAGANEQYRWYTENVNPPVGTAVSNPVSVGGTYYGFTYNTSTTCFSSTYVTATLTLNDNNTPVPLASSFTACDPATFNLASIEPTAPSGTTWEWQTSSTYNGSNISKTVSSTGTNTYYLFGRNSTCTTAASASVTVTINTLPTATITTATESACSPSKVDITNNYTVGSDIYQWYTVSSNPTPATLVSDPTQVSAGTYYLYATNTTTLCQTSSPGSVVVTINSPPTISITTPSLICEGTSVNIVSSVSSGSPTYQWYSVNTASNTVSTLSGSPYSNETTNTLTVNPTSGLSSYLFYVTATLSGCSASSSMVPIPMSTVVSCTSQPINSFVSTLPNGTYFSFSVDDFNANIQWQRSKDGGTTWRNLDTAKSYDKAIYYGIYTARLDVLSVHDSMNNYQYRAIATTSPCSGGCTTSIATLTTPVSLPVSGMKLTGAKSGDQLELKWYVMSEEDVEYYVVMYAENGQDFTSIGKVWVPNPSFTAKSYSYGVPAKKGYYKIQAVAERHAPVFSNVFWYQSGDAIKTGINPNPVQADKGSLLLSVSGVDHELPFKVNVHGVDGRLIQSAEMKMQSGTHVFQLNENALSGSLVILSIVHPDLGVIQRKKVIIQH
jgi:hypothetical protein